MSLPTLIFRVQRETFVACYYISVVVCNVSMGLRIELKVTNNNNNITSGRDTLNW